MCEYVCVCIVYQCPMHDCVYACVHMCACMCVCAHVYDHLYNYADVRV